MAAARGERQAAGHSFCERAEMLRSKAASLPSEKPQNPVAVASLAAAASAGRPAGAFSVVSGLPGLVPRLSARAARQAAGQRPAGRVVTWPSRARSSGLERALVAHCSPPTLERGETAPELGEAGVIAALSAGSHAAAVAAARAARQRPGQS